jgi:3-isopropylmalate/(R)-2-methylmalate dehydratase large subunit
MGMTMAERLFSRKDKTGNAVNAGDFIDARIDRVMVCLAFDEIHTHMLNTGMAGGLPRIWDKDKVCYLMDHFQPAPNTDVANRNRIGRNMARKLGFKHFFDSLPAVGHQVMCEKGFVRPGELILGNDSHSTLYGALNAGGTGLGEADIAYALTFGELWFQVPETIKIELKGKARPYPFAKDIILHLAGQYGDDFAQYRSIEFTGSAAEGMSLSDRMCMADHAVEVGAKFGLFRADEKVLKYVTARTEHPFEPLEADPDAVYERVIEVDVDSLDFVVAKPHNFDNVVQVREAAGVKIDQAVIGSCANGRFEDILTAAKILKGKKLPSHVRFLIQPASWDVYRQCLESGIIPDILDAGAHLLNPGCGVCQPVLGVLSTGEVCITAATRNYKGRLGSTEAFVYLAGPATVAASALAGEIVDPREVLHEHY